MSSSGTFLPTQNFAQQKVMRSSKSKGPEATQASAPGHRVKNCGKRISKMENTQKAALALDCTRISNRMGKKERNYSSFNKRMSLGITIDSLKMNEDCDK